MSTEKRTNDTPLVNRRELVKKGIKAAYVAPAILTIIKATERPAHAVISGEPPAPIQYNQ
jgi:hypothetical protein